MKEDSSKRDFRKSANTGMSNICHGKKMKDAELKVKAGAKMQVKETSSVSTTKNEDEEKELGWENVPSTSAVRSPLCYARTASSNDSSGGEKSPPRNLEETFPSLNFYSCSEISSSISLEGSPRVPSQGSPLGEENLDLKQTLGEIVEKESPPLDQRGDPVISEGQGEIPSGTVEDNVKKKKTSAWLTDACEWNIGSGMENFVTKKEENSERTYVSIVKEPATLEIGEESCGTLEMSVEKEVGALATIAEQSEVKGHIMEKVVSDTERVAVEGAVKNDSKSLPKRKLRKEEEDAGPESTVKKRKLSDESEGSFRTAEKNEQIKHSQSWQVDEKQWEISKEKVTGINVAAEESIEKVRITCLEPEVEEGGRQGASFEKEDVSETLSTGEMSGLDQEEDIEESKNVFDVRKERLELQKRFSQEEEDDGGEADTEEDVVRGEEKGVDQKPQSKGVKGDSMKHSSKKKTLVRKPDPYPVSEFLQLSYEEAFFLSYGLGCLSLYKYSPTVPKEKPMDLCGMWLEFLTLKPRFVATYACYHYYRSKGWVPRCGIKYGCDFVVYRKGPSFYHSSFAVLAQLVSEDSEYVAALSSWSRFTGFSRIVENAAKDVVVCFISYPDTFTKLHLRSPACIPHLEIQEIWVKRWRPTRGRTGKDFPSMIS